MLAKETVEVFKIRKNTSDNLSILVFSETTFYVNVPITFFFRLGLDLFWAIFLPKCTKLVNKLR
jgi:hypothetical protein